MAALTLLFSRSSYTLVFRFDEGGNAIGFQLTVSGYGTQEFWYQRNLQGDVIGIYNSSGTLIGRYTYDAWGKLLDTELLDSSFGGIYSYVLELNPIRYRGYLYDTETGLYYCQSRYYDPKVGRFLNADGIFAEINLFRYCRNCPTMFNDPSGYVTEEEYIRASAYHSSAVNEYCQENNIKIEKEQPDPLKYAMLIAVQKGITIDGWYVRIDPPKGTTGKRHIHIERGDIRCAQNIDGTRHDGTKCPHKPPNTIKKKLKKREFGIGIKMQLNKPSVKSQNSNKQTNILLT